MIDSDKNQQIEAGKQYAREILSDFARQLEHPEINRFEFRCMGNDFDIGQISVFDPERKKIVLKLTDDNLADSDGRQKIKSMVEVAVRSYLQA